MQYPIDKKINKIREFLNFTSPRKKQALMQDSAMWYMLCSSMDIIEDMEIALESYLAEDADGSDLGKKYLLVFGALQTLYVQQDGVRHLHDGLDIPYTMDPLIKDIREIRNDVAGHPTNRCNHNKTAFNFITRIHLGIHEFQLTTIDEYGNTKYMEINIPDLIATQQSVFLDVLENVIKHLKEEEMNHRKKFTGKKLDNAFSDVTYPFEKIFDAVLNENSAHATLVGSYVDRILGCYLAFRDGLKERGEPDDNNSYEYEHLEYTLKHIKDYFDNVQKTHVQGKDLYVFACFARQIIDELRETARFIDEKYNSG